MYDYRLSLYEKAMPDDMDIMQKLSAARRCGFDSIEVCIDACQKRQERLTWDQSKLKELCGYMRQNSFRIYTVSLSLLRSCPLGVLDDRENARSLEIFRRGVEFTASVGARVMLINGYDVYGEPSTPETTERFARNLEKAGDIAAINGVTAGIENAEMPFIDTIGKAAYWIDRISNPYIRIFGDTGNIYNAIGADTSRALADLESGRGKIAAMHLKDSLPGKYRYVRYGEGHVDFNACITKLTELGVRIFTAELFLAGKDWEGEAKRANDYLRRYFEGGDYADS